MDAPVGGGVLCAVRRCFSCSSVDIANPDNLEVLCVELSLPTKRILIVTFYIPPADDGTSYESLLRMLESLCNNLSPSDEVLCMGDFNIPRASWCYSAADDCVISDCSTARSYEKDFLDGVSAAGLSQASLVVNEFGKSLDLIFTTAADSTTVTRCQTPLLSETNHHPAHHVKLCFDNLDCNSSTDCIYQFNFKKADFHELNDTLASSDWSPVLSADNIESASANFYTIIFDCFSTCVPLSALKSSSKAPWLDKDLLGLKNQKAKAWKKFCFSRSDDDYQHYAILSNLFIIRSKAAYLDYLNSMKAIFKNDPKQFWNFVNRKRKSDGYPASLSFLGTVSNDSSDISNMFCDFFKSAFDNDVRDPQNEDFEYLAKFPQASLQVKDLFIDEETISRHVAGIPVGFGCGPDGVPACVIKNCASSLNPVLCFLFNLSLKSGVFPSTWKQSLIIPHHKKGARNDVSNYRPIACLPSIAKLFEAIIVEALYFHTKSLINPSQHGFTKGRSTTTNLVEFSSFVINSIEKGKQVDCIFTDFSKAFDRLNHRILILKLGILGFPLVFLNWLSSYLSNRYQRVLFRGTLSQEIAVTSGVPQGSHLGPLLFVLFINDASAFLSHSRFLVYADDTKIFREVNAPNDCVLLNNDLNDFYAWCVLNRLPLNVDKCSSISFCRKNIPLNHDYLVNNRTLSKVDVVKDLGVVFNKKFTFDNHLDYIVGRANSILGFVKRWAKEFNDPYLTKTLYCAFVRSILEYASVVWDPYYAVGCKRVEGVQRRFLRFCLRDLPWDSNVVLPPYVERLQLISLDTLEMRRKISKIMLIHKVLAGVIDSPSLLSAININVPQRRLRNFAFLNIPQHRTNYGFNEPITSMCRLYNSQFDDIDLGLPISLLRNQLSRVNLAN